MKNSLRVAEFVQINYSKHDQHNFKYLLKENLKKINRKTPICKISLNMVKGNKIIKEREKTTQIKSRGNWKIKK